DAGGTNLISTRPLQLKAHTRTWTPGPWSGPGHRGHAGRLSRQLGVAGMDVAGWLRTLNLERYEGAFRDNEIDFGDLPELTDADLEKLGIPLGPRRRLLKAIRALPSDTDVADPVKPPPMSSSQSRDSAERRQLTVMFCDLVG